MCANCHTFTPSPRVTPLSTSAVGWTVAARSVRSAMTHHRSGTRALVIRRVGAMAAGPGHSDRVAVRLDSGLHTDRDDIAMIAERARRKRVIDHDGHGGARRDPVPGESQSDKTTLQEPLRGYCLPI